MSGGAGSGNDLLRGGDGIDVLRGQSGDDELVGDDGDDTIIGGEGNDLIHGRAGLDSLSGSEGNDAIIGPSTGVGGPGFDGCDDHATCETPAPAECKNISACPAAQRCQKPANLCIFCQFDSECDDSNPLTIDTCRPTTGCHNAAPPAPDGGADGA